MRRRLPLVLLRAWLAAVVLPGCSGKTTQAAGLEVIVATSGLTAGTDFDTVEIVVQQETSPGGAWHQLFDTPRRVPSEITLPTTFSIQAGSSPDQDALIEVTALKGGTAVVQRVAQVQVPTDRVAELLMVLAADCVGKVTTCPNGSCQPATGACGPNIIATTLPNYTAGDENRVDAGVSTVLPEGGADAEDGAPPMEEAAVDGPEAAATDATVSETGPAADAGQDGTLTDGNGETTDGTAQAEAGDAPTCTDSCTSGQAECVSGSLATCTMGSNGCRAYGTPAACPGARQSCTGSVGSASCTCNADPVCHSVTNVCTNSSTVESCAQDQYGCFYQASTSGCSEPTPTCSAGSCTCTATICDTTCLDTTSNESNCGACGHACSSANASGTSCSSSACDPSCYSGYVNCATPTASADDGCECQGTACCGASCQTQHSNGVGQSWYDCFALSTYNVTTATSACAAFTGNAAACARCDSASVSYFSSGTVRNWFYAQDAPYWTAGTGDVASYSGTNCSNGTASNQTTFDWN
jgi:hypothetical protein